MNLFKILRKGFTLVELVIVIAVVAILTAVLIPTFSGLTEKAQMSACLQEGVNEFKVCYAEDISDGYVDGIFKEGTQVLTGPGDGYYVGTNPVTKSLIALYDKTFKEKYRVTYDGAEWKVAKSGAGISGGDTNVDMGTDEANSIFTFKLADNEEKYIITGLVGNVKSEDIQTLVIPATINGIEVIGIGDYAFANVVDDDYGDPIYQGYKQIQGVIIPETIKSIGSGVFAGCTSLTEIYIDPNNEHFKHFQGIVYNADYTEIIFFVPGRNQTEIEIPNGITSIKSGTFLGCQNITKVSIPESVKTIESEAFSTCGSLETITIAEGVETIEDKAFYSCISLKEINIPNSVTEIGSSAFYNCVFLESVTLSENIDSISDYTFSRCESLKQCIIPDSVETIGKYAFDNCKNLTSLEIPSSVTTIEDGAFNHCESLKTLTIPSTVTELKYTEYWFGKSSNFFNDCNLDTLEIQCDNLTFISGFCKSAIIETLIISGNNVTIENEAFRQANITNVKITGTVTSIGDYAFAESEALTTVVIEGSVTSVGYKAFIQCKNLNSITIPNGIESVGSYAFGSASYSYLKNITFLGTHDEWKAFKNIMPDSSDYNGLLLNVENMTVICSDGEYKYKWGVLQ